MKQLYRACLVDEKTVDKRTLEISQALTDFKKWYCTNYDGSKFQIIEDAPRIISTVYHEKLYEGVKRYIHKKTSRYKMASLTELCVVIIQPFRCKDETDIELQREINAQFAFFLSTGIIYSLTTPDKLNRVFPIIQIGVFFEEIKKKHLEWLAIKPMQKMCVISNEHTLALFHHFYIHRWNSMQSH